jgi:hypothetical protein
MYSEKQILMIFYLQNTRLLTKIYMTLTSPKCSSFIDNICVMFGEFLFSIFSFLCSVVHLIVCSFCLFSAVHCLVCPLIYLFRLPLCYDVTHDNASYMVTSDFDVLARKIIRVSKTISLRCVLFSSRYIYQFDCLSPFVYVSL